MGCKCLEAAKKNKNDEFYTLYEDVEKELSHYSFRNMTVLCPCEDYDRNFHKYFEKNFDNLGLKRLIVLGYGKIFDEDGGGVVCSSTRNSDFQYHDRFFREADIIVTNPPFSIFRQFYGYLEALHKQYLLLCTYNILCYKDIFPYIVAGKAKVGYGFGSMWFDTPQKELIQFSNIAWLTTFPVKKEHFEATATGIDYPVFDGTDVICVDKVKDIPKDYMGVMGVPITFFKYLDDDWELLGEIAATKDSYCCNKVNGKKRFTRLVIRRLGKNVNNQRVSN